MREVALLRSAVRPERRVDGVGDHAAGRLRWDWPASTQPVAARLAGIGVCAPPAAGVMRSDPPIAVVGEVQLAILAQAEGADVVGRIDQQVVAVAALAVVLQRPDAAGAEIAEDVPAARGRQRRCPGRRSRR